MERFLQQDWLEETKEKESSFLSIFQKYIDKEWILYTPSTSYVIIKKTGEIFYYEHNRVDDFLGNSFDLVRDNKCLEEGRGSFEEYLIDTYTSQEDLEKEYEVFLNQYVDSIYFSSYLSFHTKRNLLQKKANFLESKKIYPSIVDIIDNRCDDIINMLVHLQYIREKGSEYRTKEFAFSNTRGILKKKNKKIFKKEHSKTAFAFFSFLAIVGILSITGDHTIEVFASLFNIEL